MKRINVIRFIFIATSLTLVGCNKYKEGGLVSKAEKNLTSKVWKLDAYYRNNNDETSKLLISNFTEEFLDNGSINRSYKDNDGDIYNEIGSWSFDEDKQQLKISEIGSIELTDETSTVSSSDYNILKLNKKEFWYFYENGGDEHEFHFVPN